MFSWKNSSWRPVPPDASMQTCKRQTLTIRKDVPVANPGSEITTLGQGARSLSRSEIKYNLTLEKQISQTGFPQQR